MQPTIASFFQKANAASSSSSGSRGATSSAVKDNTRKRKAYVISSDEEEAEGNGIAAAAAVGTPLSKKSRTNKKTDSKESDSSSKAVTSKKPQLGKLKDQNVVAASSPKKAVDPMVVFGGETKRVQTPRPPRGTNKNLSMLMFEDDEIEQSMMEIGEESVLSEVKNSPNNKTPSPNQNSKANNNKSPKEEKKANGHHEGGKDKKQRKQDLETSVLTDEERYERKRASAVLYQKYKNRSTVLNHGCKEIPNGKANCLAGLSFLVTGVLESLERDEVNDLVKQYGGKVMTTVGKRLNYLIVGEEAGPKKLSQAQDYGVKIISEDDFLELIRRSLDNGEVKREENQGVKETNGQKSPLSPEKTSIDSSTKSKRSPTKKEELPIDIKREDDSSPPEKRIKKENEQTEKSSKDEVKMVVTIKQEAMESVHKKKALIPSEMMAWVDKYKPTSLKDIVGQQGAASNVVKLKNWLSNWYVNHDGKKKLVKPNPWAKNDDGSYYKAALLSGPPGIGKTTTATLVSEELGFDIVEMNASDTRSKRLLQEEVTSLLSNKSLAGYFHGSQAVSKKHVLLMDEVDGMAGNEDRGGIQELIGLIKNSSVPIICMCNDRNHQKMRSLVNYCYDLRFQRPQLKQIKSCIMSICSREKVKLDPQKIEEIIAATNNDIRQSINHVSLLSAGKELESVAKDSKTAAKDLKMGPWEVVRKVFSVEEHQNMSLNDKYDLFFHDYSLGPLFIQQNYLSVSPAGSKSEVMAKVAKAADALSLGDLVERKIRSQSAWSLLPTQATFSSVLPGEYMKGYLTGQINFPLWLGKNSRTSRRSRLAQEIHDHTRIRTSGSRKAVHLEYGKFLLDKIVHPLRTLALGGVDECLNTLKEYHLLREDIDSLVELTVLPGKKSPLDSIEGKVKAALTRAYNKEVLAYSYSVQANIKKKRAEVVEDVESEEQLAIEMQEEGMTNTINSNDSGNESDDNVENDALIKMKKKTSVSAGSGGKSTATGSKKTAGSSSKPAKSKARK